MQTVNAIKTYPTNGFSQTVYSYDGTDEGAKQAEDKIKQWLIETGNQQTEEALTNILDDGIFEGVDSGNGETLILSIVWSEN